MNRYILALGLLIAGPAFGQSVTQPQIPPGTPGNIVSIGPGGVAGDSTYAPSTMPVTATGGTTARTLAGRAADVVNIADFGAKCDGVTDDAADINAAFAYARTKMSAEITTNGQLIFAPEKIVFPAGVCLVKSTLNWTGLQSSSLEIDATGATIYGKIAGSPVIDALGSKFFSLRGLTIQGDNTSVPSIGMQIGRINTTALDGGGSGLHFVKVGIFGNFTLAGLYNLNGEVSEFDHIWITNYINSPTAYALIQDGVNHFGVTSAFVTESQPADSPESFEQNVFIEPSINCSGCTSPVWMSNTSNHQYINAYLSDTYTGGSRAITIYEESGVTERMLDVHLHSEQGGGTLKDVFYITGTNPSVNLQGLRYKSDGSNAAYSLFNLDTTVVTSAVLSGADISIATMQPSMVVFKQPNFWSVSGSAYVPAGSSWNLPKIAMSGYLNIGGAVSNAVAASSINVLTGGVVSVTDTSGEMNVQSGILPVVSASAPPSGGTQASATISSIGCVTPGNITSGGSGYAVGDYVTMVGGTYTSANPCVWKVATVGTGGTLSSGFQQGGSWFANTYTTLPAGPISFTATGAGSGLVMAGANWNRPTYTVTSGGSGYTSAPTISVSPALTSLGDSVSSAFTSTVAIGGNFSVAGAQGSLLFDTVGTKVGINGPSGAPVISEGATIDGSGVRVSLGSAYTVPANTSLVRFIQTGTLAASTVTLPTALADGQPIQFVNYAGAVTALTFSPAVNGWTNGATLASNTGLRVRWDATSAAWYREQ